MSKAVFIVSKHPFGAVQDGETRVTRLLLDAAAATCSVSVVALSTGPTSTRGALEVVEVRKPPVSMRRLAVASGLRRRSLIHERFAPRGLVQALEIVPADVLVARRVYMAQGALDARRVAPSDRLVVLADVLESTVMRSRRSALGPLLAVESSRTRRDEIRCVRAASAVAFFSDTESRELAEIVAGPRLDLSLPPAERPAWLADPVAVFVGDRRWPPNAEAFSRLRALWPRIAKAVPRARLLVVGHPAPRERRPAEPSVETLGFVEDLEAVWRSAAVLLAPVSIGGGVRVKVLDAARHGVPVVGTPAAIGATSSYLPLRARTSEEEFTAHAVALLGSAAQRRREGEPLFEANRALHARGFVEEQLARLLVEDPAQRPMLQLQSAAQRAHTGEPRPLA